jgi:hypothetical protein
MAPNLYRTLVIWKVITKWITTYQSIFKSLSSAAGSVVKGNVVMDIKTACRSEVLP